MRNYYNKDVYHSLVPIDSTSERSVSNSFRVTTLIHNNNKIPNKICPAFSNLLYTDDYQTRTYTISYHLYNTSVLTRNILDLSKYKSISNNSQPPPLSQGKFIPLIIESRLRATVCREEWTFSSLRQRSRVIWRVRTTPI